MDVAKLLLCFCIFMLSLIQENRAYRRRVYGPGSAIKCFSCWTKDQDNCGFPDTLGEPENCEVKDNVCKKVVTKAYSIIKKGRDSHYELVSNVTSRLCGKSHWTGCHTMYGAASETIECACDESGCNSAPTLLTPSSKFFIVLTSFVSLYKLKDVL